MDVMGFKMKRKILKNCNSKTVLNLNIRHLNKDINQNGLILKSNRYKLMHGVVFILHLISSFFCMISENCNGGVSFGYVAWGQIIIHLYIK